MVVGLRTRAGGRRRGAGGASSAVTPPAPVPLPAVRSWGLIVAMGMVAHPVATVIGIVLIGAAPFVDLGRFPFPALPIIWMVVGIVRAAFQPHRLPGRVVRPADEPELAALVRRIAEQLDFHAPLLLRVVPTPDAGLGPVKVSGRRGYVLLLGWPLLRRLTVAQLAAVVAHETAYQQHLLSLRDRMLALTRDMLEASLDNRIRVPRAVSARLLRATQEYFWHAKIVADARSAEVAGTTAVRGALQQIPIIATAFEHFVRDWISALADDSCPEDLYEALDAALDDPHVVRRTTAAVADEESIDLYATASHPPLRSRLAALPETVSVDWDDSRPVTLRQTNDLQRWCVRELSVAGGEGPGPDGSAETTEAGHGRRLPIRILDTAPERLYISLDAGAELMRATGRDSIPDAAAAAVAALADGSWPRLAQVIEPGVGSAPPPLRAAAVLDVMAGCLAYVISGLLRDAGWEPASRWLTTVLLDPDGEVVDVRELIERAMDGDPGPVRSLLAAGTPRAAA